MRVWRSSAGQADTSRKRTPAGRGRAATNQPSQLPVRVRSCPPTSRCQRRPAALWNKSAVLSMSCCYRRDGAPSRPPLAIAAARVGGLAKSLLTISGVVVAALSLLPSYSAAATSGPETNALVDFWNATGFPASLSGWANGDPCTSGWTGVACSTSPVSVT